MAFLSFNTSFLNIFPELYKASMIASLLLSSFSFVVLKSLSLLHAGETLSYKDLATQIGQPKSARAVGTCMRLNPWPLLVPCHRIIPSSGGLGNYSLGGPAIKASLLQMEEKARLKLGQK